MVGKEKWSAKDIENILKAKKKLNWKPKTNLIKLIKIMVDEELKYYQRSRKI